MSVKSKEFWPILSEMFGLQGRPITKAVLLCQPGKPVTLRLTEFVDVKASEQKITRRFVLTEITEGSCQQCGGPAHTQRSCPYDEEVKDLKTVCNCCDQCYQKCFEET